MDPLWLLVLLPVAAFGGWLMAKYERNSEQFAKKQLPEAYFRGLRFLVNEQPDKALQVFLEVVEVDNETIEIHLTLGNLFRRQGEVERATRIHQNILARSDIAAELRTLAVYELAQDYFQAGLLDRAENLFVELRQADDYYEPASQFLLKIYEQEKEWHKAIDIASGLGRDTESDLSGSLSQYHCELAEQQIVAGNVAQATDYLESAFRYEPCCVRAVLQSGRVAAMRGNHKNAIAIWRGLEDWAPQALVEAVEHISNSYSILGERKNYRQFLLNAARTNPDLRIINALIEVGVREDDPKIGPAMLLSFVRDHPSLNGFYELLKQSIGGSNSVRKNEELTTLMDLLSNFLERERGYNCRVCGFQCDELHWQCPGCKRWGSVQPNLVTEPSALPSRLQQA